jgi:hypothetical protein
MALGINILSAFDNRGIEKAIKEFAKLETVGQKAQFAIQKAALPAAAALAGLAFAATKAVQAGIQEQQEMTVLASTLERVTGASQATIAANEQYLASLQRTTIYSDSEMRPALAALVTATGDLNKSQQDLTLAMDIATATGVPLVDVASALAKAYNDNFKSLKALSPALADNIKDGQTLDQIFTELSATFGGATAAAANTAAGRMTQLRNSLSDVQEAIGMALLPILEKILPYLQQFADWAGQNTDKIIAFGAAIGTFSTLILALAAGLKIASIASAVAAANITVFGVALTATGIGAIVVLLSALAAAIVYSYQKFGNWGDVFKFILNGVIAGVEFFVNTFIRAINSVIGIINGLTGLFSKIGLDIPKIGNIAEVSFGRLKYAAESTTPALVNVGKLITDAETRLANFGNTASRSGSSMVTLASATAEVKNAEQRLAQIRQRGRFTLSELKDATDAVSEAQKNLALITGDKPGGVSKAVETAREKIAKLTDALRSQTSAQRSARDAAKATAEAQRQLATANEDVTIAQAEFTRVISGFGKDSKQAKDRQQDLEEAQREVERSGYDVEEAIFAVTRAEQELAKVRLDPESNATAIRQAEIALAEAKLSVKDAQDRQRQSTVALDAAQTALDETVNGAKEGTDAYKTALDNLNKAKKAQEDAIDRVAAAQERERDAILEVADAQRKLNDLTKEYGKLLLEQAKARLNVPQVPSVNVPTSPVAPLNLSSVYMGAAAVGAIDPGSFFGADNLANEYNVTINAGMGTDAQAVAREFIDYLKQYERANGYVPITAEYAAFT